MEARRIAIDFSECEFTMSEFYEYLGLETDQYISAAVERAKAFADRPTKPSVWNLQLALKRVLLEEYDADRAADRFLNFQAIAGKLLRYPESQVQLAYRKHKKEQQKEEQSPEDRRDNDQIGLQQYGIEDLEGVTEGNMNASEASQLQERIESQLDN